MMSSGERSGDRAEPHRITYTDNFPKTGSERRKRQQKRPNRIIYFDLLMALYGQQHAIIAMRFACSQQIAINTNSIETTNKPTKLDTINISCNRNNAPSSNA